MKNKPNSIRGVISTVVRAKNYVVSYPSKGETDLIGEGDSITFSLQAWTGESQPQEGQLVLLRNVTEFSGGWRAEQASPIRA